MCGRGKIYSLTDAGRDAARQMALAAAADDPVAEVLRLLEQRPLSAAYVARKLPLADRALRSLERKGFIAAEQVQEARDPLRSPAEKLRIEGLGRTPDTKLPKAERELLAFLELHPGSHNLKDLDAMVRNASPAARSLARRKLVSLKAEPVAVNAGPVRARHVLNPSQQAAFESMREAVLGGAASSRSCCTASPAPAKPRSTSTPSRWPWKPAAARCCWCRRLPSPPPWPGSSSPASGTAWPSSTARSRTWSAASSGAASAPARAGVVVGTRSGVFAPVRNLGLIIVDEEHDGSYKQEENPRYHGRDVAVVRAQAAGACVVLGSATPSLESRYNVERGKYALLELPDRIERRPHAPGHAGRYARGVPGKPGSSPTFSRKLMEELGLRLENGEQSIVLLNRRGFSSFVACRACGERIQCANCSLTLTFHRRDRRLLCHYCNYAEKVPSVCPHCQSEHIYFMGIGSERVEDELHRAFPKARIARLDRDTVTGKRAYETILQGFREGDFDILVGTQMIAKGHDIPNVTLVGVVSADVGLGMPDFRAAERTFQLLTQVAGRAGRGELPGTVLVQTINPDHYAVRLAAAQDYAAFYAKELSFRRMMHYPPFSAMANLLVRSEKQEQAHQMACELGHHITPPPERMRVMGPAEAPVVRLKAEYRYQFLIKAAARKALNQWLRRAQQFALDRKWPATALVVDVDPLTLM